MGMENNNVVNSDKLAIIHVLAALIQKPYLFNDNNYKFSIEDFPEQFHKILFAAIEHLARNGMENIGYIDIDQFLKQYTMQYQVFIDNRGIEYIQNALNIYDDKKFDYYYNSLKKYSLINLLNAKGIDTTDIYNPNIIDPIKSAEMYEKFDNMSVNDIIVHEETKVILAKEMFGSSCDRVENNIGNNLEKYLEELNEAPEIGLPSMSPKITTLFRGQRQGCVYMMSAPTSVGKTRVAVGEACHLAIPEYYDPITKKWVNTGLSEPVLIIETELELSEVQTMVVANVSGVPESKILDSVCSKEEKERIRKATQLILNSKLFVVELTNYNTEDLIELIKKYYNLHDVRYIFYDYLSENIKIMAESTKKTRVSNLRTDQILLMMITSLKDCAKQLGVYIWTATQVSGDYKGSDMLDSTNLRSAKSLGDKVDIGGILTWADRECDKKAIEAYSSKGFELVPDFVLDVYKIRRGTYQKIHVYFFFDRGICRLYDTFVTDKNGNLLPVTDTNVNVILDKTSETSFATAYIGEHAENSQWDGDF